MNRFWRILGALWPREAVDSSLPALGTGEGYVPTLQADNTVKWRLGGTSGVVYVPMTIGNPDDPDFPGILFTADGDVMMVAVEI